MTDQELKKVVNEWCANVLIDAADGKCAIPEEHQDHEKKFRLMAGSVAEGLLSRNNRKKKD